MDNKILAVPTIEVGFWRGVGYFISIIIIIVGIALFPVGIIGIILGAIFIWMLRRSAGQERIEKRLKEIDERDKARSLKENADRDKERTYEEELKDARMRLEEDERKLAALEKKREEDNRK
jgi:uncharacterized membrane protein (DUF106 family)